MTEEKNSKIFLAELILTKNYGFKVIDHYPTEKECDICCDPMKNTLVITTPCGHKYHHECLLYEAIIEYGIVECPDCNKEYKFIDQEEKDANIEKLLNIDEI